ncbi:CLR6 [Hepatospora eriocheir]|uniref:Histone deacetylase n=2 Tax=Hepatospora eriocheir TaxID=1081669 RepID=A0A1X0QA56_9MICR|nr:CLR6 [Hepatospora eriocheir]
MKPLKVTMTNSLVMHYNLHKQMDMVEPYKATYKDLVNFHSPEYIKFLSTVSPANENSFLPEVNRFNVKDDCPIFPGLYDYCRSVAGATMMAANKLNSGEYETIINWSGGFHHAKVCEASGFCYVNDINLGILELLKIHNRVLYIDIDVHHGDGVEEAFYITDRVMTASFHKYGDFFPGTGRLDDVGFGKGKNYSINVPLKDGIDDKSYEDIFVPVIQKIIEVFQPSAILMQCGGDSLSGDRLGCFNLTHAGHGRCVEFVKSFNLPLILVGGGGYTIDNVAKAWTYETGIVVGSRLDEDIPYNQYLTYFAPNYKLKIPPMSIENMNTRAETDQIISTIHERLRGLTIAPSVQMSITPSFLIDEEQIDSDEEFLYERILDDNGFDGERELEQTERITKTDNLPQVEKSD